MFEQLVDVFVGGAIYVSSLALFAMIAFLISKGLIQFFEDRSWLVHLIFAATALMFFGVEVITYFKNGIDAVAWLKVLGITLGWGLLAGFYELIDFITKSTAARK